MSGQWKAPLWVLSGSGDEPPVDDEPDFGPVASEPVSASPGGSDTADALNAVPGVSGTAGEDK